MRLATKNAEALITPDVLAFIAKSTVYIFGFICVNLLSLELLVRHARGLIEYTMRHERTHQEQEHSAMQKLVTNKRPPHIERG